MLPITNIQLFVEIIRKNSENQLKLARETYEKTREHKQVQKIKKSSKLKQELVDGNKFENSNKKSASTQKMAPKKKKSRYGIRNSSKN